MKTGRILAAFALALLTTTLHADPSISAKISATETTLDSQLTLLLEVQGINNPGGAPQFQLPDFQVQPAGQTSSFQWINGQTSSLVTYNYILTPNKTGQLTIPALTFDVGGKQYSTQPITVTVRDGGTPAATSAGNSSNGGSRSVPVPTEGIKPVFMTASVDIDKVYVGQQVILKVLFLRRPDIQFASQARYSEPNLTGFLVESLDKQEYSTTINGQRYEVTEIPYALFPTSDGELAIGSAQVEVAVQTQADPFDPNSFFQSFFGRAQVARLNTRAIPIRVRALPQDKPTAFSGAVGRYKVSAKIDTDAPEVGKPFNLIYTVDGVGNIKSLKEPALSDLKGFRKYETISESKLVKGDKFVHGTKDFKTLLIPQVSGALTIPAIPFSFFNPSKAAYETVLSNPIELNVKPGQLNPDEPMPSAGALSTPGEGVRVMERDIRFIKSGRVYPVKAPIYLRGTFYALLLVPLLFLSAAAASRWRASHRSENWSLYRSKGALGTARRQLKEAAKQLNSTDPVPFYGAIYAAVAGFLADKLTLSASGLIWDDVERQLFARQVPASLVRSVRDIFDQADMARFASSSFTDESRAQALEAAKETLTELEQHL